MQAARVTDVWLLSHADGSAYGIINLSNLPQFLAKGLSRAFDLLAGLPEDFLSEGRQDHPPQQREGL